MKAVGLAAAVAILATACLVETETHRVWNYTTETVYIFAVGPSGEYSLGSVKPGLQRPLNLGGAQGCYTLTLVARTGSGREVSRHSNPFCPDQSWLITDPAEPVSTP